MDIDPTCATVDGAPSVDLATARAALDTAHRARKAARKPAPVPTWYIIAVTALLSIFVASTDAARALSAPWLIAVSSGLYAIGIGICIAVLYQRVGVVSFQWPYLVPSLFTVMCCIAAGGGTYAAFAGASMPLRGVPAAVVGGAVLFIGMRRLNARIARDAEQWRG